MKDYTLLLVIFISTVVGYGSTFKFEMCWDNLGYSGAILHLDGKTKSETTRLVYESLKSNISNQDYLTLTGNGNEKSFNGTLFNDPTSHDELIPTYKLKILFVSCSYLLYKVGIPLALCAKYISILFFILTTIFWYQFVKDVGNLSWHMSFLIYLLVTFAPLTRSVAILPTPDMMSCFLMLLSSYFVLKQKNAFLILLSLVLCVLTRADNILYALSIIIAYPIFTTKKIEIWNVILALIVVLGTYFTLTTNIQYPGWRIWFYHAFIEKLNYPLTAPKSITFTQYVSILIKRIPSFVFPYLVLYSIVYFIGTITAYKKMGEEIKIVFASVLFTILIRYFLFPYWDIRFYLPFLLILILVCLNTLKVRNEQLLIE